MWIQPRKVNIEKSQDTCPEDSDRPSLRSGSLRPEENQWLFKSYCIWNAYKTWGSANVTLFFWSERKEERVGGRKKKDKRLEMAGRPKPVQAGSDPHTEQSKKLHDFK